MSHQLTVASLNTWGIPLVGSQLSERYTAIAGAFEASEVDVVNFFADRRPMPSGPGYLTDHLGLQVTLTCPGEVGVRS